MTIKGRKYKESLLPLHMELAEGKNDGESFRVIVAEPPYAVLVVTADATWEYPLEEFVKDAFERNKEK